MTDGEEIYACMKHGLNNVFPMKLRSSIVINTKGEKQFDDFVENEEREVLLDARSKRHNILLSKCPIVQERFLSVSEVLHEI